MEFQDFSAFAHRLADAAAEVTLPLFRASVSVDDKGGPQGAGFDPVTEADRGSETAMRRLIEAELPEHGILGEEFEERETTSGWRWVLDPVDGTRSFISGIPLWTTIIGLERDGVPVYGMVDQPYVGDRFWGHGSGSFCRNRFGSETPMRTRACASLDAATLMTTSPSMMPDARARERYDEVESRVRLVRYGADAYAYQMLAAGRIDLVVEAGLQPYDIVGIIPIVEGAGGLVTTWEGAPAAGGGAIVAAGDARVHAAALKLLAA